jgi:HK97 family phage major capsid protein
MSDTKTPVTAPSAPDPVSDPALAEITQIVKGMQTDIDSLRHPQPITVELKQNDSRINPRQMFAAQVKDVKEENTFGWKSFGEYARGVSRFYSNRGIDPRLEKQITKAAQGMGEALGSDGGHMVPPVFSMDIFERVYANDLLSRTDQYTTAGDSMSFLANAETSRVDGSRYGGARSYWLDEGSTITKSKPTFRRFLLRLHKLATLAAVTEELLADSAISLEQYLVRTFSQEIAFQVGAALYRGSGSGKPLGLINLPCLITVAKETGQAATTIVTENIVNMFSRLWAGSMAPVVWRPTCLRVA